MNLPDPDRALGLLRDLGYRYAFRLEGWVECLVWQNEERWIGRGASRSEAVDDVLRRLFPSRAAQQLLVSAARGEVAPAPMPVVPERRVPEVVRRQEVPPRPTGIPQPTPQGPVGPMLHIEGRDPEVVLADVGLLDELIDSKRPELALMTPARQRMAILSWICHARAVQGVAGSHSRVVTAVTHIARKLTLLSKRWWPGSVLSLQLDATPFHVGRELDLARADWPRSWTEAATRAEERLRALSGRDAESQRDLFGWPDSGALLPMPAEPDKILNDVRLQVEQIAGPLDHKPPNRASEGIRRPVNEMRERQRYWAQLVRWMRCSCTDYVAWGALMGRLRWMSTQASRRDDLFVQFLSPDYIPEDPWAACSEMDEESERRHKLRSQVLRRATILKNVDLDAMLTWLFDAFDVLDSNAIARQLAPFRRQILDIRAEDLPEMDDARRQRLTDVQSQLAALKPEGPRRDGGERILPPGAAVKSYASAADGFDPMGAVRDMVLPHTTGKSALYVSPSDPGDHLEALRERFGFDGLSWVQADAEGYDAMREAVGKAGASYVISATEFFSHDFDLDVIRQCRRSDILHVRAHGGDAQTVTLALARQLGLKRTAAAL